MRQREYPGLRNRDRGGGVDSGSASVRCRERRRQRLVWVVVYVDQAKIVILAVGPPALRMVVVLKPVETDNFGNRCEIHGGRRGADRSFLLGRNRHQMTVVTVPGSVVARGKEPFGDEHGLATR